MQELKDYQRALKDQYSQLVDMEARGQSDEPEYRQVYEQMRKTHAIVQEFRELCRKEGAVDLDADEDEVEIG